MSQVSPSTSITIEVRYPSRSGMLARITGAIGEQGAIIRHIHITGTEAGYTTREIGVEAADENHEHTIAAAVAALEDVELLHCRDRTFELHAGGKIEVTNRIPLTDRDSLSRAYTPGVARVCERVKADLAAVYRLTVKGNMVAIVSDGSAVLGLGNIGPYGALPVMEGKAMLFKTFAGVDAFPLCLDTQDVDEIVETVKRVAPVFGGVNLEDIAAPRCFAIEDRLRAELDIPVFHDDQHGTAVVVCAGLTNALKVTERRAEAVRVVISGAGAAGIAVAKLLRAMGVGDIVLCDTHGAIYRRRPDGMNPYKERIAEVTNRDNRQGDLEAMVAGAEVFVGVSKPGVLSTTAVRTMAADPIVFALANPVPEVDPWAVAPYVGVLATGRSDLPNQINNAIAFPGIFRGLLDCRAVEWTESMLLAAAGALAAAVPESVLCDEHIIPSVFETGLAGQVAAAVGQAAKEAGVAREMPAWTDEVDYSHP